MEPEPQIVPTNTLVKTEENYDNWSAEDKIKHAMQKREDMSKELRKRRSMLKSALEKDAEYYKAMESVSAAQQHKNAIKKKLMKDPSLVKLAAEVDLLKEGVKSLQLTISDFLLEYKQETGNDTIEDNHGNVRRIRVAEQAQLF